MTIGSKLAPLAGAGAQALEEFLVHRDRRAAGETFLNQLPDALLLRRIRPAIADRLPFGSCLDISLFRK